MNNNPWVIAAIVAVVFGAGGYYAGTMHSSSSVASASPSGASAGGFAGRGAGGGRFGGGAAGGFTAGTILSIGNGTMTIQLAQSTSTSATTGTKIVLFDTNTTVSEMQSVPASTLTAGQSVVVSGSANADGSVTATSIQVRPSRPTGQNGPSGAPSAPTAQ